MKGGLYDVFYGPIRDNTGNIRVSEGENMSDEYVKEFDKFLDTAWG